ncbi:MAG: complex I subunit 5 family protein [Vicinamibacterales bacterium]
MLAASGLLIVTVCVPLAVAVLLAVPSLRARVVPAVPWAAAPALALALLATPGEPSGISWLLLGAHVGIDDTGRVFLLFSAVLWLASGLYARHTMAGGPRPHRFFALFLATMAGNLGVIVAADAVTFYLCFALMSFASYGLVVHAGDPEALRAGRVYMAFVIVGEVLLFLGMVGLAGLGGATEFSALRDMLSRPSAAGVPLALIVAGLAVKTAAFPLHMWLPLAHRAAPPAGSAVLSGTVIKAGLLGWLRFLPLGTITLPALGMVCLVGGLFTAFWGVLVGVTQKDPKGVLGYSSISQMGLITTGVGMGLLAPAAWPLLLPAICLYAFHHALAKAALFLGTGIASGYAVTAPRRGLLAAGIVVSALALAGAPFTSGAAAKVALKAGFDDAPLSPALLEGLLSLAAVGTTLLLLRFLALLWAKHTAGWFDEPAPAGALIPCLALAIGTASVWFVPWMGFADSARQSVAATYLWSTTWPVLLGAALFWLAWLAWRTPAIARGGASLHIPPGDVLALLVAAGDAFWRLRARVRWTRPVASWSGRRTMETRARTLLEQTVAMETRLQRWDVVGALALVVVAAVYVLLVR